MPRARVRTASRKPCTTGRATSASRRARRTSRSVSPILSSVSFALPPRARRVVLRRSVKESNMGRTFNRGKARSIAAPLLPCFALCPKPAGRGTLQFN
jgi:hypothetical protein